MDCSCLIKIRLFIVDFLHNLRAKAAGYLKSRILLIQTRLQSVGQREKNSAR